MLKYQLKQEPDDINKIPYLNILYSRHRDHIEKTRTIRIIFLFLISLIGSFLTTIGVLVILLKIENYFFVLGSFFSLLIPFYNHVRKADIKNIKEHFEKYESFLRKISEKRENLVFEINELWKLIQKDKESIWVNSEHIGLIKEKINTISEKIKFYFLDLDSTLFQSKKEQHLIFPWLRDMLKELKSSEEKELLKIWEVFTKHLKNWSCLHQSELQELEKSIQNQANQTENVNWKVTLQAQKVRLQSYIESINNLVE